MGLAAGDQQPGESTVDGVRIVRVRAATSQLPFLYSDPARPHMLPVPDPLMSRAIRRELAHGRFDVVHAHNWIANSALGPTARARVPLVMTLHDYSHICTTARMMEKGSQRCAGPSLSRCLSCASSHYGAAKGPAIVAANAWSAWQRSRRVTRVAAVSGAVAGAVRLDETSGWLAGAGLDADVIPNFIPDELVVDDVPPAGADAPLLFAGDLVPDKGIHVLLDAYRRLDDPPRLVLAGRPTPEVASTLPDGVHLAGALPHGDVLEYFRSARAVIVPSVWSDPCPTVVLEAMAAGRPVVAAASGGILDMVVDGNTGLLVPPGDAPALARAILTILENPRTAHAFGVAGRDRARQFTVSAVVERIEHMYLDAIDAVAATGSEVAHVG
jgi:glycosyltransferase involved in cell wall biosynthesis